MVCVAAVALGSSTYAWFVSNNTVKGTTTNISAQSNAPFRKIDSVTVTESSGTTKELTGEEKAKADKLANSRFAVGDAETAITGNYAIKQTFYVGTITGGTEAKFESAYASGELLGNKLPEHLKSGGIPPFFRVRP